MPQIEIKVWDTLETVTWIDGADSNTMRVVWHRHEKRGVDERLEVRLYGDSRHDAIARELRRRVAQPKPRNQSASDDHR